MKNLKQQYKDGALSKKDFIDKALDSHKLLFEYAELLRETEVREISINEFGVNFKIGDDISLYSPPNEGRVAPIEILNFDTYEINEREVIDKMSSESVSILDIGANIGWYSIYFAKKNPKAKIYSFEPIPTSYSFLQKNIAQNFLGERVSCFNHAVSDKNGLLELFISPGNGTNASIANVANENNIRSIKSYSLTVDEWCNNQKVSPDFIKCDVEGAELLVFQGGVNTLINFKPIVFTELLRKWTKPFGYHPNDVILFFKEIDYRCYAIGEEGVQRLYEVTESTSETNYIFLHELQHSGKINEIENHI